MTPAPRIAATLLGTGGPRPDPKRNGPATLVRVDDRLLLFDAGRGVVQQLLRAGIPLAQITLLFITHHHYDHIGELADLILSTWLQGRRETLRIFGPPGTKAIVDALLTQVYDKDIEFRDTGEPALGGWRPVEVAEASRGTIYEEDGIRVLTEPVVHGHGLDFPDAFRQRWICLGYRLEIGAKVIAISGDTVRYDGLGRLARNADVLVQCCYLAKSEINAPHWERTAKYTLACADTVGRIATDAAVKTLILTHFREKPSATMQALAADVRADFAGTLVLGEDLLSVSV